MHKQCDRCKIKKPIDDFAPDILQEDGRTKVCRACVNERRNAAYARRKK